MTDELKAMRLNKVAKELNVGIQTIVDYLQKKGHKVETNPNAKISQEMYDELLVEFSSDSTLKKKSAGINLKTNERNTSITIDDIHKPAEPEAVEQDELIIKKNFGNQHSEPQIKIVGKIELDKPKPPVPPKPPVQKPVEPPKKEEIPVAKTPEPEKPAKVEKKEAEIYATPVDSLEENIRIIGKVDLESLKAKPSKKGGKHKAKEEPKVKEEEIVEPIIEEVKEIEIPEPESEIEELLPPVDEIYRTERQKLSGPTVVGKITLATPPPMKLEKKRLPEGSSADYDSSPDRKKKKRKRIKPVKLNEVKKAEESSTPGRTHTLVKAQPKTAGGASAGSNKNKKKSHRYEVDNEAVDRSVKDTMASLNLKSKSTSSKYRREKRDSVSQKTQDELDRQEGEKNILKITEFVSVNELAILMNAQVNDVISTCMNLGLFVSINQRLDAETLSIIADEFGYKVEFITVDVQSDLIEEVADKPEDLQPRPPIVTVMGHVDHGKTKLLDYIRNTNVVAGEAGGITQHIGAYSVKHESGRMITFLDTPGHEAFTAMRARGAQLTDVSIIVIAADDGIKPQTIEAINHAQAANVPMVFAINKIDKAGANPEKIREELSQMNILVEEWGGKFQSQEIAAKPGTNVNLLLDKVMLEADMLDLKANPNREASGVVIESSLDKGRGYIINLLVKNGTLHVGDVVLAGSHYGKVKAMFNERNVRLKEAGPATPLQILGLNGAPQAGDKFNVLRTEQEAKEIANKRIQILREQGLRTQKHITLEEIGRRLAIGNFKELNIIVKGDVDGSIEALSDSLIKLSNEEIQVNVIHKAVGQISESDIMLAAASNAVIIGFQVRPSVSARKIAEKEQIQIRLYSIIYDAIEEIKQAMEGMLSPVIKEEIIGSAEIREVFKITKVGTIAGCIVNEGKILRSARIRIIRDGIVVYTGELGSLKRFKDDAKEVASGLECGLNIERFNDIKVGDIVEAFTESEVKKKL